jgi:hypothetical protein
LPPVSVPSAAMIRTLSSRTNLPIRQRGGVLRSSVEVEKSGQTIGVPEGTVPDSRIFVASSRGNNER